MPKTCGEEGVKGSSESETFKKPQNLKQKCDRVDVWKKLHHKLSMMKRRSHASVRVKHPCKYWHILLSFTLIVSFTQIISVSEAFFYNWATQKLQQTFTHIHTQHIYKATTQWQASQWVLSLALSYESPSIMSSEGQGRSYRRTCQVGPWHQCRAVIGWGPACSLS